MIHKKNQDPSHIANRHPITLANTDLKLISTTLSTRIQTYAPNLIHPDQAGFMKGRHIYDTILDLNTLLNSSNSPPQSFILSLDWSKAYNRVSHHWLDHVLEQISFPRPFRRLLHATYHHRHSQLSINGLLGPSFPISKGVPQGDPVAPVLFNLSIEPLFNALRSARLWVRAYADDTYAIRFDEHAWQPLHYWLIQYNLAASGEVHWGKTKLIPLSPSTYSPPPNTPPPSTLPLSTLGVLLPLSRANIDTLWDSLTIKLSSRVDSLFTQSLSLRGRILIAKSLVLSKVWYHSVVAPPSAAHIKQVNALLRKLVWHN